MKILQTLIAALLLAAPLQATAMSTALQSEACTNDDEGIYEIPPKEEEVVDNAIVEVPASYPGGEAALLQFVSKNLVYPAIAHEQELQGVVILRVKVETDGSVRTIKVEKSLSKECDQAAAAVVKKLHRFTPAKQQGHPVPVWFRLPIRFQSEACTNDDEGIYEIPPKEEEVVDNAIVEVPASYPGGEAALLQFVSKNLVYPAIAHEQELQGVVILRVKVETDGSVRTIKVEKSLSKECDQAAAAVVKKLHRFTPAKQQGHPVPVWFRLPIRFQSEACTNDDEGIYEIPPKEEEVVDNAIVEVPASYPGGEAALLQFVSKNLVYPAIAHEQKLQGVVILRVKVETDGSVRTVKVEKSVSKECDQAAAAVVKKLHRFTPAKQQGRPVPIWFRLPICFRIQ